MPEVYDLYSTPTGTPADTVFSGPYISRFSNSQNTVQTSTNGLPISAQTSSVHNRVWAESSISLFSVQNYAVADSFSMPKYISEGIADLGGPSAIGTMAITNDTKFFGFDYLRPRTLHHTVSGLMGLIALRKQL